VINFSRKFMEIPRSYDKILQSIHKICSEVFQEWRQSEQTSEKPKHEGTSSEIPKMTVTKPPSPRKSEGISHHLSELDQAVLELQQVNISKLSDYDRKNFFLNIYNFLYVHLSLIRTTTTTSTHNSTNQCSLGYFIGNMKFTLYDILHGILRGNSSVPFSKHKKEKYFEEHDVRKNFAIESDPRVHFALINSGLEEVPLFTTQTSEKQLQHFTKEFITKHVEYDSQSNTVKFPQILKTFDTDFGITDKERLSFVLNYVSRTNALHKVENSDTLTYIFVGVKPSFLDYYEPSTEETQSHDSDD